MLVKTDPNVGVTAQKTKHQVSGDSSFGFSKKVKNAPPPSLYRNRLLILFVVKGFNFGTFSLIWYLILSSNLSCVFSGVELRIQT